MATETGRLSAAHYQEMALKAFLQDIEVWKFKAPCINGMFIPSDGAFAKARVWYQQFYNPQAKQHLDECEGVYLPQRVKPYTEPKLAA